MPSLATIHDYDQVSQAISRVDLVTQHLFGSDYARIEREDPEVSSERFFVYCVKVSESSAVLLRHFNEWHAALAGIPESMRHLFRLSLDIQE